MEQKLPKDGGAATGHADIKKQIYADKQAVDEIKRSIERIKIKAFVRDWLAEYNKIPPQERVDNIIDTIHRQLSDLDNFSR